jgi:hypothetical protein
MKKMLLMATMALAAIFGASAEEYRYTTAEATSTFGNNKAERYDVAVLIKGTDFVGKQIVGAEFPVPKTSNISGDSIWMSEKLAVANKYNVPDVCIKAVTASAGKIKVTFDQPYTITADGVYVGYTFTVTTLDDTTSAPIYCEKKTSDAGFWIHTQKTTLSWRNKSESDGITLAGTIVLSGGFDENAVQLVSLSEATVVSGTQGNVGFTVSNMGTAAVNSLDVSYAFGDYSGTQTMTLSTPIAATMGATTDLSLTLPAITTSGEYPFTLSIDKVNGQANTAADKSLTSKVIYQAFIPKHRAVVEESTGTWCQNCPRGLAAMEHMSKNFPDFIGIAYHNNDPMMSTVTDPSGTNDYPVAYIDRNGSRIDPYFAGATSFNLDNAWLAACDVVAPADVDLLAYFTGDDSDQIDVRAFLRFPVDRTGLNMKVAYFLLADSLAPANGDYSADGAGWKQINNLAGKSSSYPNCIEELKPFLASNAGVVNATYDHVAILASDPKGIEGSVPTSATAAETIRLDTYSFDTTKAYSTWVKSAYEPLVQDRNKLHVVVLLIDGSTGAILNANKAAVLAQEPASIGETLADDAIVAEQYYDLSGRRVSQPTNGIYVRRATTASGHVISTKVRR